MNPCRHRLAPRGAATLGLAAVALFAGLTDAIGAEPQNAIPNPSFQQEDRQKPVGWKPAEWGGKGTFVYAKTGRDDERSVMIESIDGADIAWSAMVPVEPNSSYRLSGWIKTENVRPRNGRGALLNLHNIQGVATKALTGTSDWTQVEVVFDTGDLDAVQVNCLFGGWGLATGKAWYDDLGLTLLEQGEWDPSITIDAARTGEPISRYIYGQFIEHLGRCIYGGIWAEMLEDRKFYYAVGDKDSPWKPLAGAGGGGMDKTDSFVGEHTPKVAVPGGIEQAGLGLVKDRKYVGHIWLQGDATAAVEVSLVWSDGPKGRETAAVEVTPEYAKTALEFTAGASTGQGRLEIKVPKGKGTFHVGTVSLMPADNVHGMRADTLELLKQLDSPVYRWPGGNFVSGYDWRDGIGDRDRRPPRKNPAWKGVEHNDFGLDEFMLFCKLLGTEPYIAVNSGLGQVDSAVAELQYANGPADSPMGKLRVKNGHPQPYGVKWWGIGNEMYGGWQLGHMPLEDYIKKHNVFAEAMRKADPSIKLVAVGATGKWSEGMMQHCADHMDLVSEHFYRKSRPSVIGHVRQMPEAVREKAEAHRDYRQRFDSLKGKDIRIALDEWNYWYGPHVFGELGTRYFLKDGLGVAAALHEYARQSDIMFMANYAQTVNVIGCIKTSKTAAAFETTGLVLKLYRREFGTLPVAVEASAPIDAMAAWTEDHKVLTLGIVNPTKGPVEIPLTITGAKLAGTGRRFEMAGDDPMACNDPDQGMKVKLVESPVTGLKGRVSVKPYSVTLLRLDAEER